MIRPGACDRIRYFIVVRDVTAFVTMNGETNVRLQRLEESKKESKKIPDAHPSTRFPARVEEEKPNVIPIQSLNDDERPTC